MALSLKEARHLVERAGIGAEWSRIGRVIGRSRSEAVKKLLRETPRMLPQPELAPYHEEAPRRHRLRKAGRLKEVTATIREERRAIWKWAVRQMLQNPAPVQERMVWFWLNHFTISCNKVQFGQLVLHHDRVIRQHALGRFPELLRAACLSPAMLIYLDGRQNRKEHPNENFARELLELFTLGEGHYTEKDIREAARAFTGWIIDPHTGLARFVLRHHDDGVKEFLGQRGRFRAEDIFNIILDQPRTAEFICEKLWHEFVSLDEPPRGVIRAWATVFRESGYNIRTLLNTILASDAFWSARVRGGLVKSPMDYLIGTLRTFGLGDESVPTMKIVAWLRELGQALYAPPDVKGWRGGRAWLDDVRLLRRQVFLRRIFHHRHKTLKAAGKKGPLLPLPTLDGAELEEWLLALPAITDVRANNPQVHARRILFDPVYHVK